MNKREARSVLASVMAGYRSQPYALLAERVGQEDVFESAGPSGAVYQVEVQFFWDDRPGGPVHVLGAIDDGGLRAFLPLCDDFIASDDGEGLRTQG